MNCNLANKPHALQQRPDRILEGTCGQQCARREGTPYARLAFGYAGLYDKERRARVTQDYAVFLSARADILAKAAQRACGGKTLDLNELFVDEN
jgi:hypothetical protein